MGREGSEGRKGEWKARGITPPQLFLKVDAYIDRHIGQWVIVGLNGPLAVAGSVIPLTACCVVSSLHGDGERCTRCRPAGCQYALT